MAQLPRRGLQVCAIVAQPGYGNGGDNRVQQDEILRRQAATGGNTAATVVNGGDNRVQQVATLRWCGSMHPLQPSNVGDIRFARMRVKASLHFATDAHPCMRSVDTMP